MATTRFAHPVALNGMAATKHARTAGDTLAGRLLTWFREIYCGLHGHDSLMQFGKDRMYLQCVSCGHESPGWALTEAPPRIVVRGNPRRRALARPRLVAARRIA